MKFLAAITLFFLSFPCSSQELSCNQLFMNKSEKAICGSTDLILRDQQIGTLSRRAEILDPQYSRENREFRSALRKCKGELTCISEIYTSRLSILRETVDNGRTLTEDEINRVELGDRKAEIRFAAQEHVRERYSNESRSNNVFLGATQHSFEPGTNSEDNNQTAPPPPITPDETVVSPHESAEFLNSQTDTFPEPPTSADQAELPHNTNEPVTYSNGNDAKTTVISIWNSFPRWVWVGVAAFFFILILRSTRRRCPRCGKRGTSKELNRKYEGTSTEYRDVNVEDKHKNSRGEIIKTVSRTEQRATQIDHYTVHFRCSNCRHEWRESI